MVLTNQAICVAARPSGIPTAEHFRKVSTEIPSLTEGQLLIKNEWLSVEPAMRGWLADANNYASVNVGEVMRSLCVGVVVASKAGEYQVGERLMGWFGWQEYAVVQATAVVQRIETTELSPSLYLGILGLNGVTAATALDKIADLQQGDVVVVSTAAGGVGSCVGQLAKLKGCRTVGLTSTPEKVKTCYERFRYDHVINYRTEDVAAALKQACPDGVNVYFDNTAGAISDAVMQNLAIRARVIICGTASVASWDPIPLGPRTERIILTRRARVEGFIVLDHQDTYATYVAELEALVKAGKLSYEEHITEGLDSAMNAIAELYRSENVGKRLVRLP